MSGTPRNERYGSSPASRKYLNRGCEVASATHERFELLGDESGQTFREPHADAADAFGAQPDGGCQHKVGAVRFEQVDRTHVGGEPPLNQVDDVAERFGGVAAARCQTTDFFQRPEQRSFVGDDGRAPC